ncbi:hypothetical protein AYI68_g5297 [Smittium mucronatum]|uniref:Uncharacterized protein n=1 Tax=Smittium mucronatum TaxID=133383 RepID=A0A1R0GUN8_9FUNG|nr:hypothetical protein AYI68_g5297 [Smittium mucronatum]
MYRKDYYPNYNKLLCRSTGCVPSGKGFNIPTERPPMTLLQIRPTVERWTCALDYVSAVLNNRFLLFRDGPPLESLSSKSLCAVSAIPNQE